MKTNLILSFFLLLPIVLGGQTQKPSSPVSKGVSPIAKDPRISSEPTAGQTYAVVVGISDYQDKDIPDLRFADKDAEAFANFLRSPSGGSLDGDHLKLLTNKEATTAQFDAALGWLIDVSKEGDQAIIYFSGHGDVETKTRSQQGFLLCWDSPPQAYVSGAYPIFFLKEVISTLSIENKARVMVVTDACRSGKLAGNSIGGQQLTSQNLAQQFANEIKILSCQPNEYSIEGEQWGGGRGAFSFYLVDGLYGMADSNADGAVNLMEIGRYLEDHVTSEVAPQSQVPMTSGNRTEKLAVVFPEMLAQVRQNKVRQLPIFSPTDSRGIEEDVLAMVDTTVRELYKVFKQALKDKVFLEPVGACADAYYERLLAEPKMERLQKAMRRNYAAALQDDAQQAINNLMKMEHTEILLYRLQRLQKYRLFPRFLARAADLLGPDHYIHPTLQARKSFFEGWLLQLESPLNPDSVLADKILGMYRKAVALQPGFTLAYYQMSTVFDRLSPSQDSLLYYGYKSIELAPTWTWAMNQIASAQYNYQDFDAAKKLLTQSLSVNTDNSDTWNAWGVSYFFRFAASGTIKYLDSMEQCLFKALSIDSLNYDTWNWLGILQFNGRNDQAGSLPFFQNAIKMRNPSANVYMYIGSIHSNAGNFEEAARFYKKGLSIEPNHDLCLVYLAGILMKTQRGEEAKTLLLKAITYDSTTLRVQLNVGNIYFRNGYYSEAEVAYKRIITLDSSNISGWLRLGDLYWVTKQFAELEQLYKKAAAYCPKEAAPYRYLGDLFLQTW